MRKGYSKQKEVIVGAGILGGLEAYSLFKKYEHTDEIPRVTMYHKETISTAEQIAPSLTPRALVSVIPPVGVLLEKWEKPFTEEETGIRVEDVPHVNTSSAAKRFIDEVRAHGGRLQNTEVLLALGKLSMEGWQKLYEEGDEGFKKILEDSNFKPCFEPSDAVLALGNGYHIVLVCGFSDPQEKAKEMIGYYEELGYHQCKILSPQEVEKLDPALTAFSEKHSHLNSKKMREWDQDVTVVYLPGGCINAGLFLPKLYAYLEKKMDTYTNEKGEQKNRFRIKSAREVEGVLYADENEKRIQGLTFTTGKRKTNERYQVCNYLFCPGGSVGTLEKLGFDEPASVRFAGASLKLKISFDTLPEELKGRYAHFNQWMNVVKEGGGYAWQGKRIGNALCVTVAGSKAFYGREEPEVSHAFAKVSTLRQLESIRQILPDLMHFVLGKEEPVTEADMRFLMEKKMLIGWVGSRAVAYDGNPTVGNVRKEGKTIDNGWTITHAGSGGISFGPGLVAFSQRLRNKEKQPEAIRNLEKMTDVSRTALKKCKM